MSLYETGASSGKDDIKAVDDQDIVVETIGLVIQCVEISPKNTYHKTYERAYSGKQND